MYSRTAEPGAEEEKMGIPQPGEPQPPPYSGGQPMPSYPPSQPGYPPAQQPGGYPPAQQPVYPTSHSSNTNTTVVIQQPQTQVVVQGPRQWSTGICSCFDDCGVCLLGLCCPCILECTVSAAAGECCCVASLCPIALRTKIRTRHNIHGSILDDCCMIWFCRVCALCQMQREVNIQGMKLKWIMLSSYLLYSYKP